MIEIHLDSGHVLSVCLIENGIRINGVDIVLNGVDFASLKYSYYWKDILRVLIEKLLDVHVVSIDIVEGGVRC